MEKFNLKNRYGLEIVGSIEIPENSFGLVFVQHGLGGFKEQPHIKTIADTFFENDYTIVNFDATNSIGESGGKYEDATLGKHYEDLVDVINWSKSQDWYKEPIVLSGHSMGGYTVVRYAEDNPNEVKAVFSFAPLVSGELSWEDNKKYKLDEFNKWKKTGWKTRFSKSNPGLELKLPWSHMEERLNHDLLKESNNLKMPIALITGNEDTSCSLDSQRILFDRIKSQKDFYVVNGARHTFREPEHLEELKNHLNQWLQKI